MPTETVHPSDLSLDLVEAWRGLCAADPAFANPLLGPDFARAVGAVRPDARVTVFYQSCAPVAFWPHHIRPGGLARPIGAPFSDYHALVASPAFKLTGAEALEAAGIKRFPFDGLVDPQDRFGAFTAAERVAWGVHLPGTAEDYLEALRAQSPKRFKNMRRLGHKLEREVGEITLTAPDRDPEAFERLFAWKREQFRTSGLHDVLAPAWVDTLMRTLFETRTGHMQGLMVTLRVAGQPVAAHFGVRAGRAFHPWVAAFDPELAPYGPGIVLMTRAIAAMPALGLTNYDLSGGHEHYKRPFSLGSDTVRQGEAVRGAARAPSPRRFADRAPLATRVGRRLDHIAAAEPSLAGRVRGVLTAVRGMSRRLNPAQAAGAAEL